MHSEKNTLPFTLTASTLLKTYWKTNKPASKEPSLSPPF